MKRIVFLTGAGMSAESGISTFRDSDGLWEHYSVEEICTHEAWLRTPEKLLDFYNMLRRKYMTELFLLKQYRSFLFLLFDR